jgi:methyl-accepting chemotaxis protein
MNWFKKQTIGTKLMLSYSIIVVLILFIGYQAISKVSTLSQAVDDMYNHHLTAISKIKEADTKVYNVARIIRDYILAKDQSDREKQLDKMKTLESAARKSIEEIKITLVTEDEKSKYSKIVNDLENYLASAEKVIDASNSSAFIRLSDQQYASLIIAREKIALVDNAIMDFSQNKEKMGKEFFEESKSSSENGKTLILVFTLIGVVLGMTVGSLVSGMAVRKPVHKLVEKFNKVFDFSSNNLNVNTKDEIDLLTYYIDDITKSQKKLADNFLEQSKTINDSSDSVFLITKQTEAASSELLNLSNTAAASSEQVTANISSVSTAAEEMTSSIKEIAKNTNNSSKIIDEASQKAIAASEVMNRLGTSSSEIGNIVKVITSIAEQTNLLALNATIEAARAGEAGKGFAVVATEVKELAKETAKATEDITKKIKMIQADSSSAIDAIREITEITKQVNDISNSIASAVEEQTVTSTEINRNIGEALQSSKNISETNTGIVITVEEYNKLGVNLKTSAEALQSLSKNLEKNVFLNFKKILNVN